MKKQKGYYGPGIGQLVFLAVLIVLTAVETLTTWIPVFGW